MAAKSVIVRNSSQKPEPTRSRLAARSSIFHGRENDHAIRAVPVIKRMRLGTSTVTAPGSNRIAPICLVMVSGFFNTLAIIAKFLVGRPEKFGPAF